MAKVIVHTTLTLDGFIARPNDEIDWAFKYAPDEMSGEIMTEIGAVVMGNRGYIGEDSLPYGGQVKVPQFVVTHKPRDPRTIGGLTFTFVDSIERAITLAKAAAGVTSVTLLGASIDQQALNAGLAGSHPPRRRVRQPLGGRNRLDNSSRKNGKVWISTIR